MRIRTVTVVVTFKRDVSLQSLFLLSDIYNKIHLYKKPKL